MIGSGGTNQGIYEVPTETARIAHAAFLKGDKYMRVRDELRPIYEDEGFKQLFDK